MGRHCQRLGGRLGRALRLHADGDPFALDAADVTPVVDTAEQKGQGEDRERPTDPTLRCLALTTDDAQTLQNILSQ